MRLDPRLARMRSDVPGAAWLPLFSARIGSLAALVHQLDRSQWLDPREIEIGQHRQLGRLAAHLAEHNATFRARLEAAGLDAGAFRSPAGLTALPPLTRQQVQATDPPIFGDVVPKGHEPINLVNTSGSTGEPVIVHRTAVNQLYWLAMTLRYHLWSEPDFNRRICAIRANLRNPGLQPNWGAPANVFFDTGPGLVVDIECDLAEQIDHIEQFRPNSLIAYPSNLVALIDEMEARGVRVPELRRFRTLGETIPDGLRERIEAFGGVLYDCYSSEEMGYIALQCPDGGDLYHVMAESVIVEVVDDEGQPCGEGESGRVLVTDIQNYATPMIRYAIADHAEVGPPCPCGRGLPTLRRILGRERNMIVRPDGTRHWPLTGYKKFREIAPIAQYQYCQHAPDTIEVRLVAERPLTSEEETNLRDEIIRKLRHPFNLNFTYFEGRLPVGKNGKFEEFLRLF